MDRFSAPGIDRVGVRVLLDAGQTRHLVRVRRVGQGDEIALFDGEGIEAVARFAGLDGGCAAAEVVSFRRVESPVPVSITIATAIPKGHRMADLVRACTEVGVSGIRPMIAARSVVRPELGGVNARWQRVAREAAKQSLRPCVPSIAPVASFEEVAASAKDHALAVLADCSAGAAALKDVLAGRSRGERVLLVTGPEGGFTDAERDAASRAGMVAARLAAPVMRIETAAPALCAVVVYAYTQADR